jgi:hypothetical protein
MEMATKHHCAADSTSRFDVGRLGYLRFPDRQVFSAIGSCCLVREDGGKCIRLGSFGAFGTSLDTSRQFEYD